MPREASEPSLELPHVTTYSYDAQGRLTQTTDPRGSISTTTYDTATALPLAAPDHVQWFRYDALGRDGHL
jgi:YD repeat-containing protein